MPLGHANKPFTVMRSHEHCLPTVCILFFLFGFSFIGIGTVFRAKPWTKTITHSLHLPDFPRRRHIPAHPGLIARTYRTIQSVSSGPSRQGCRCCWSRRL